MRKNDERWYSTPADLYITAEYRRPRHIGLAFRAASRYLRTGMVPERLPQAWADIFFSLKAGIDNSRDNYEKACKRNKAAAQKREKKKQQKEAEETVSRPVTSRETKSTGRDELSPNTIQNNTIQDNTTQDKREEDKREKGAGAPGEVCPPTVEEVAEYCRKHGFCVEPESFVDYYAAQGWLVGRTPIRDWQAKLRLWEKKQRTWEQQAPLQKGAGGEPCAAPGTAKASPIAQAAIAQLLAEEAELASAAGGGGKGNKI